MSSETNLSKRNPGKSGKYQVLLVKEYGHNCTKEKMFTRRCQRIFIDIVFDDFDIRNTTYNAKFEEIELFSVVGGYLGLYLGASLVAVFDIAEKTLMEIYRLWKKHGCGKKFKQRVMKRLNFKNRHSENGKLNIMSRIISIKVQPI